jgi:hypothetical protein
MKRLLFVTSVGILVALTYDVFGSMLSRSLGFNYGLLAFGSPGIYCAAGYAASKNSYVSGVLSAAIVGFVDATLGWYLSWLIGPITSLEELTIFTIVSVVPFVTGVAIFFGIIGAAFRWYLNSK